MRISHTSPNCSHYVIHNLPKMMFKREAICFIPKNPKQNRNKTNRMSDSPPRKPQPQTDNMEMEVNTQPAARRRRHCHCRPRWFITNNSKMRVLKDRKSSWSLDRSSHGGDIALATAHHFLSVIFLGFVFFCLILISDKTKIKQTWFIFLAWEQKCLCRRWTASKTNEVPSLGITLQPPGYRLLSSYF